MQSLGIVAQEDTPKQMEKETIVSVSCSLEHTHGLMCASPVYHL